MTYNLMNTGQVYTKCLVPKQGLNSGKGLDTPYLIHYLIVRVV